MDTSQKREALPHDRLTDSVEKAGTISPRKKAHFDYFHMPARSSVWRRGWKVPVGIVGFFLLALLCAVAHLLFFKHLDGRVINLNDEDLPFATTTVPQSYATTASLAFVTVFRAALVASIGLCYTQCLWQKLRKELLEVGQIEELFQVRANAFRLLSPAMVRYAPVLMSVALISWLLPVAMIYPPGSLVVGLEYRQVSETYNVSVYPADGVYDRPGEIAENNKYDTGFTTLWRGREDCNASSISTCIYTGSNELLQFVANSVLSSSRLLDLDRPSRENASYNMHFRGPRLQCQNKTITDRSILSKDQYETSSKPGEISLNPMVSTYYMNSGPGWINLHQPLSADALCFWPCPRIINQTLEGFVPRETYTRFELGNRTEMIKLWNVTSCVAATADYDVNISFPNGIQKMTYSTRNTQKLPLYSEEERREGLGQVDLKSVRSIKEYVNLMALIDSLGSNFDFEGEEMHLISFNTSLVEDPKTIKLESGADIEVCPAIWNLSGAGLRGSSFLTTSAFKVDRARTPHLIRPTDFHITEELLNEALANITISALSLNIWRAPVNGSATRPFTTYHFERLISFYLPYVLSLLLTLPVLVIGMSALQRNGVTAIDGGFVQILMTTTGRTELEEAAAKGCLGGEENVPKELKKLKVRFGEMVMSERMDTRDRLASESEMPRMRVPSISETQHSDSAEVDDNLSSGPTARDENDAGSRTDTMTDRSGASTGAASYNAGNGVVRRAGFGSLAETMPLEKGVLYGHDLVEMKD